MGWYKRSKLAFDFFRNSHDFTCIITPDNNPIQNPIEIHHQLFHTSTTASPSISQSNRRTPLLLQFCKNKFSPFLFGVKKNYSVDERQLITKFLPEDCKRWVDWKQLTKFLQDHRTVLIGAGLAATVCLGNLETVPYSNRTHLILLSHNLEKKLGERQFKKEKEEKLKGKILPEDHPQSARVRLIAKNLLNGLQSGLGERIVSIDHSPNSDKSNSLISLKQENNNQVEKIKKKGKQKGKKKTGIEHMELFNWEVLVVKKPVDNAFCMPGGKIVIYTGALHLCKTDAEIAATLGHEIAHALARHTAEGLTEMLWIIVLMLILSLFVNFDLVEPVIKYCLELPFSRKKEIEADYIGLLLMASVGYDPRVALSVWKKSMEKYGGRSKMDQLKSTHPSDEKRFKMLSRPKVMEEALRLYQERTSRHKIEG